MSATSQQLGATLNKQNEILGELLDIILKQRDALKAGRHTDLQSLMSELRQVSVRCQAIEAKRVRSAEALAQELGCEQTVADILRALPDTDDGRGSIETEGRALLQVIERLKIEMSIISKLMEEAKTLNEMLITEWQKLSLKSLGSGAMGTFDAKI